MGSSSKDFNSTSIQKKVNGDTTLELTKTDKSNDLFKKESISFEFVFLQVCQYLLHPKQDYWTQSDWHKYSADHQLDLWNSTRVKIRINQIARK